MKPGMRRTALVPPLLAVILMALGGTRLCGAPTFPALTDPCCPDFGHQDAPCEAPGPASHGCLCCGAMPCLLAEVVAVTMNAGERGVEPVALLTVPVAPGSLPLRPPIG